MDILRSPIFDHKKHIIMKDILSWDLCFTYGYSVLTIRYSIQPYMTVDKLIEWGFAAVGVHEHSLVVIYFMWSITGQVTGTSRYTDTSPDTSPQLEAIFLIMSRAWNHALVWKSVRVPHLGVYARTRITSDHTAVVFICVIDRSDKLLLTWFLYYISVCALCVCFLKYIKDSLTLCFTNLRKPTLSESR